MTVIADVPTQTSQSWRNHGLALSALILLIAIEFHDALRAALTVWWVSPTYSHCFLIIPIAAWLTWERRAALRKIRPSIAPHVLWLIPPLLLVWWLGELSAINEVRQYAIVAIAQVAIVAMLGFQVLRIIWFPVFFLLFLVPTGEYLIAPMQRFAAQFVDISLNLLRIPHYTEGTTFELTNGRFEIAEACAGLRFLVATVTLGILFSYLMYRKVYKILLFLIASVTVPLIGNGLRCVGIILLAHFTNNEYGAGADHIVYGWGFNVAILMLLIFLGSLFRDNVPDPSTVQVSGPYRRDNLPALALVMVTAATMISVGPAFAWWRDSNPVRPNMGAVAQLLHAEGWEEKPVPGDWQPYFPNSDVQMLLSRDSNTPVDLFIGYYARPRAGHTMTSHLNQPWNDRTWHLVKHRRSARAPGTNLCPTAGNHHQLQYRNALGVVGLLGGRRLHPQPFPGQTAAGQGGA